MQTDQLRQQLSSIEQYVDNAAKACQANQGTPEFLRHCLSKLEQESDQVKRMMAGPSDEQEIRQCVDRLEEQGDLAMKACDDAEDVDPQLQSAIRQAHDAISDLKRQLH